MSLAHIVIIEDEVDLLELQEYRLEKEGYKVTGFLSTKYVEDLLEEEDVDLMIVDRNLSGVEGSEFIKKIRAIGHQVPVIFVSAKNSDSDIEEGFLRGGDDYLTKPFNMNELVLRVKSIIRRTSNIEDGVLLYRDITINLDQRVVRVEEEEVKLSKLEFELLSYMIQNKNIVMDRYQLLENVWKDEYEKSDGTVNVTVTRLKKKIDPQKEKNYIESVRGIGYKLC